jgi:hypothetical protein
MSQPTLYTIVLTPAARRRLDKLPLPAATALFEHLTGPVAANPYRLSKPLDTPFDQVRSARRGEASTALSTLSTTTGASSPFWPSPTVATLIAPPE